MSDLLCLETEHKETKSNKIIKLKLKSYIQPFEKILAEAELQGLLNNRGKKQLFSSIAPNEVSFRTKESIDKLWKRLAYWEYIGTDELSPTRQILLESNGKYIAAKNKQTKWRIPRIRKLRYGPHGIHEYRGKFFPQLVKSLINAVNLPEGKVVLDPMCGSGTANCESRSMGMKTLGIDLNPLSTKLARVKTALLDIKPHLIKKEVAEILGAVKSDSMTKKNIKLHWNDEELVYLERWFDPSALNEIAFVIQKINSCSNKTIKEFMEISLSNILRAVSWQKDCDLRIRKEYFDYSLGAVKKHFSESLTSNAQRVLSYLAHFNARNKLPGFQIKTGDARKAHLVFQKWEKACDLLITSPPYATALPYLDTDRLSLLVLGLLPKSKHRECGLRMIGNREISERQRQELWDDYRDKRSNLPSEVRKTIEKIASINHNDEIGFRRRNLPALLGKYFLDMSLSMASAKQMMKKGANAFYVVGNNSTILNGERFEIHTDKLLFEIGKKVGWTPKGMINMELLPSRDIFRNNRGSAESILWFRS